MHIPDVTEVTQHCENKNRHLLGREEVRTKIGDFIGKEDRKIEALVSSVSSVLLSGTGAPTLGVKGPSDSHTMNVRACKNCFQIVSPFLKNVYHKTSLFHSKFAH